MDKLRDLLERQHKTMIKAILTGSLEAEGEKQPAAAAPAETAPAKAAHNSEIQQTPETVPQAEPAPAQAPVTIPAPRAAQPAPAKAPLEVPSSPANRAAPDPSAEKNLDQVILEYLASEIDDD